VKQQRAQATGGAEGAALADGTWKGRRVEATEADRAAREARRAADTAVAEANRALSRAEAERNLSGSKLESLGLAVARHEEEALAARKTLQEAEGALKGLANLEAARAEVEDVKMTVEAARMTMMAKRSAHDELRREGEARLRRSQEVTKELSGWRHRLETAKTRSAELAQRKSDSEAELKEAGQKPAELAAKREELGLEISKAEARRAQAADMLSKAEGVAREAVANERDAERLAGDAREARARAEARAEAARESVSHAADRIEEELECSAGELLERLEVDPDTMPASDAIEADVNRLKRQRDALGAVNLRAEEDAREVQEEHDTLVNEKADLEEAIRTLRNGIASLNREGRERLLTAFEQVNSNFAMLFTHLFCAGEANLVMAASEYAR